MPIATHSTLVVNQHGMFWSLNDYSVRVVIIYHRYENASDVVIYAKEG